MSKLSLPKIGCLGVSLIGLAVGGILAVIAIVSVIGTLNDYSRREVKMGALIQDNKNVLDNSRKRIQESAGVSKQEVDALTGIITGYAEKRGPNGATGGGIVNIAAVREAVPAITDIKTLQTLMNLLNGARSDWQNAQTRLIEEKRLADEKMAVFPSNVILGLFGKKKFDITIVTSEQTEENFRTGKDDSNWIAPSK